MSEPRLREEEAAGSSLPRKSPLEPSQGVSPLAVCSGLGWHTGALSWARSPSEREAGALLPRRRPCKGSRAIYLKMLHELLGLDFDDNVVLLESALQHLLVGQAERGLAPGPDVEVDGELLHCPPRGPGHTAIAHKRQTNGECAWVLVT